jgi:shikimate dehydrogenase
VKRAGLIGDPVDHSLSPVMHNAAFAELGIDVRYELWPTKPGDLTNVVNSIRDDQILGANVTVPYKQDVFDLVDATTAITDQIGAVNTIIPIGNGLLGDNTDAFGFMTSLREEADVPHRAALVLGAGGASRAVLVALREMNVPMIYLANRTEQRAHDLVQSLGLKSIEVIALSGVDEVLGDVGIAINATSLGWHDDASPINEQQFARLQSDAIAMDLTYRETAFLRGARAAGLTAIDGLGMLIHQGARSFALWTGVEPPVEVMRSAVEAEQRRRAS